MREIKLTKEEKWSNNGPNPVATMAYDAYGNATSVTDAKGRTTATVLDGFYRKGNSTILITHNHQLVDKLLKQRMGVARQVEFIDDAPTHRLIAGISRVSHADRVAKKIGFSRDDINRYLLGK